MRGEQDMFNARELQKKYGSPLYVYMKEVLDTRCMISTRNPVLHPVKCYMYVITLKQKK